MATPQFLYQYTTIESLEQILKNKTIRFKSLQDMDDLTESKTQDVGDFAKYCFVSCWTYEEQQSIALWDRYVEKGKGVRIKLPFDPFERYIRNEIAYDLCEDGGIIKRKTGRIYETIFDEESYGVGYFLKDLGDNFYSNIIYTVDESLIYPTVENFEKNKLAIDKIGIYKHSVWEPQKECRYRFMVFPMRDIATSISYPGKLYEDLRNSVELPFVHYDLKIREAAFAEMAILTGHSNTNQDVDRIHNLVKMYNPLATITLNELAGQINDR